MKKRITLVALLLCLSMLFLGCGKKEDATVTESGGTAENVTEDTTEDTTEDATEEALAQDSDTTDTDLPAEDETSGEEETEEVAELGDPKAFTCIADLSDYWNKIYTSNEEAINKYEGMPIMELVTPGLCFVTGVQYDILNMNNEDGRFEGELMLAGYAGFEEKKGSQLTFGYEEIVEEDSQYMNSITGDKKVENGNCDLDKGYYFTDSYTERAGAKISRSTSEFQLEDKGMSCIVIEGSTLNFNNEEAIRTTYIFIRGGEKQYDFVVAKSEAGTQYEFTNMDADMTKDKAIALFEGAGATIEITGGIANNIIVLDE